MTGGTEQAQIINERLARVAQAHGLAMGLGSCRVLLEQPDVLPTFDVRELAPDVPLLANLGAVQLNLGVGIDECRHLLHALRADALVLHLNPLQEALQTAGNTGFSGLLARIAAVCAGLGAPVIVKEVGWGIADDLVTRLFEAGVAAVDVAGAGGTSWSEVERHRMHDSGARACRRVIRGLGNPDGRRTDRRAQRCTERSADRQRWDSRRHRRRQGADARRRLGRHRRATRSRRRCG